MTYIDHVLGESECIIHRGKIHWVIYVRPAVLTFSILVCSVPLFFVADPDAKQLFIGLGIAFLVVAAFTWLLAWIKRITTEIAVTSRGSSSSMDWYGAQRWN
jgi:hypothetical protein